MPLLNRSLRLPLLFGALVLGGCAEAPRPGVASPGVDSPVVLAAWTQWGPGPVVRAVVAPGAGCPAAQADGRALALSLRVAAGTPPRRLSAGDPGGVFAPPAFPVDICEAVLPEGVHRLALAGRALPVPAAAVHRIVVLGDTGCRLKGAAMQDCSDPEAWPFAQVARTAAALAPDLVIHVGDYHYRESPCPATAGCAGLPWGYGWDVWQADFFTPAAPLLAVAPWVVVRGNHEECLRAGQGWFRLLAAEPWTPARSCDRAAEDEEADYSAPYAVPLQPDAQLVVFDSAAAGYLPLDRARSRDAVTWDRYVQQAQAVASLAARPGMQTVFASHHPVLGFAPGPSPGARPRPGTASLLQALGEVNGSRYLPPGVVLALHGHVHLFEALGFADGHPPAFVVGNGGDLRDDALPPLGPQDQPAPGTRLSGFTSSDSFGFLLLERAPGGPWQATAYRRDGSALTRCEVSGEGGLACRPEGALH